MSFDFPWPTPPGGSQPPVWTGQDFKIGDTATPILRYETGASGWTDELTKFHEEITGEAHPIDRASRQYAREQLEQYLEAGSPIILEVGCSSGFMLHTLRQYLPHARLIGSDYVGGPLEQFARQTPDIPLLQFDLTSCPLPDNCVDAIVLLNVLEHIPDDQMAMRHVHRILKPDGLVVIEVPAGPQLYDAYDKLLHHCRRYSMSMLRRIVESADLEVVEQSHLGCFSYPGFWFVKQRNKLVQSKEKAVQKKIVEQNIRNTDQNKLFDFLMRLELKIGRWISYPFGIRCLLTCRKIT